MKTLGRLDLSKWQWLVTFVNVDGDYVREGFDDEAKALTQYRSLKQGGHRPTLLEVSEAFRELASSPIPMTYKFHARGVRQ
jgi:hypothetical protein